MNRDHEEHKPYAWAKLNAYGFVLAALAILGLADLIHPADTDLADRGGAPMPKVLNP